MADQIAHFRDVFDRHAARVCWIDDASDQTLTYGEVADHTLALARALRDRGVVKGSRVAIMSDNSLDMAYVLFAIWHCGGVVAPLNPQLAPNHLQDILDRLEPSLFLVSYPYADLASRLQTSDIVCVFGESSDDGAVTGSLNVAEEIYGELLSDQVFADLDGADPFQIIFTSGSTAAPKGVTLAFDRLVENERLFCSALEIGPEHRFLNMFPMSYLAGTHNVLLLPMSVGASIVISQPLGGANLFSFWELIRERQVNLPWFTATMLSMLLSVDDGAEMPWLSEQIKLALVGMAPLPQSTKDGFEARYGFDLFENYALSETAFLSTHSPCFETTLGSKGRILDGVSIEIHTSDAKGDVITLSEGETGEIFVKSPSLMLGYFGALLSDEINLRNGGFYTGDLGHVAGGELYLTGRKKDLIIRGGLNIAPALVEDVIAELPGILEVAIVGVPHDVYGEEVAAAISVTADYADMTLKSLAEQLKGRVAYFQQPKTLHVVEGGLPRGLTGKIDKVAVRALFKD